MDISINLLKLRDLQLTPTEYCFLVCEYKKVEYPGLSTTQKTNLLLSLEKRGWLKLMEDGNILKQKSLDIFKEDSSPLLVDTWIEEWRNIFPENTRTSGRPARGDKKACLKKMIAFCKEYPEFSRERIFEATKIYVFEMRRQNYNYMQCADYFIYKETRKGERTSLLASILEDIKDKETFLDKIEKGGNSAFHKEI